MSKQNIYQQTQFFENYKTLRNNNLGFNEILEQPAMRALIETMHHKTILDIGCGFGDFCYFAARQNATKIIGIDPAENMLAIARKQNIHEKIHYICEFIENFNAETESFDLITASLCFHYVQNLKPIFQKIYHWLKPNAQFIFSVERGFNS